MLESGRILNPEEFSYRTTKYSRKIGTMAVNESAGQTSSSCAIKHIVNLRFRNNDLEYWSRSDK